MRRGQKTSAEHVVLKLRQIEVQTAQGKNLGGHARRRRSLSRAARRVLEAGDLLLVEGSTDPDRSMAEHI